MWLSFRISLKISKFFALLCYKHEIEKTLRTPDYAGFQLLALNDYSGQGTALVGVLSAWNVSSLAYTNFGIRAKGTVGLQKRLNCSALIYPFSLAILSKTSSERCMPKELSAHKRFLLETFVH